MDKMIVNSIIKLFKMKEIWILLIFLSVFIVITVLIAYIDNTSVILSVLTSIIASIIMLFVGNSGSIKLDSTLCVTVFI